MTLVNFLDVDQNFKKLKEAATKHHTNCANCGVAKTDDIKLIPCYDCDLKSYCSDECMKNHREAHRAECRERYREIFDEWIFKQPEGSHLGDCPICFLPMPLDARKFKLSGCCGTLICSGCHHANVKREQRERQMYRCVFCRKVHPATAEEFSENIEKRAGKNDPIALQRLGAKKQKEGKLEEAASYYSKAAEFGDVESRYQLSNMYRRGEGVQENLSEASNYLVEAVVCGHPHARHIIGVLEAGSGNYDRAVKHFIIAATLGFTKSLNKLKALYKDGHVSKEDYAGALRAHKAAVDETKSSARDAEQEFRTNVAL